MTTLKHTFNAMSVKTANKNGEKYLGKNGTQAWRVSVKINEEWYSNMIWEEDMLPVKGREYNIELSEKDGFKNWNYKLMTKKEQIQGSELSEAAQLSDDMARVYPDPKRDSPKDDYQDKVSRGAAWNNAFSYLLKHWKHSFNESPTPDVDKFCEEVAEIASKITKHQSKFVNNK